MALAEAPPGEEEGMNRRTAIATLLLAVSLVALSAPASAATYLVRANGSGDFATIQDAVNGVVNTDIIELASGILRRL